jgi:hypothetical protein
MYYNSKLNKNKNPNKFRINLVIKTFYGNIKSTLIIYPLINLIICASIFSK